MRNARTVRRVLLGVAVLAAVIGSSATFGPAAAHAQPAARQPAIAGLPWGGRLLPGVPIERTIIVDGKRYAMYRPGRGVPHSSRVTTGEIQNYNSGKCLEVYNWSTSNGARVDQWTCYSGHANQAWYWADDGFVSIPGGSGECCEVMTLINQNSGKCADATNYGYTDGTFIQQWSCNYTPNQEWLIDLGVPCYQGYSLNNFGSWEHNLTEYLEVYQASTSNGARIDIYHPNFGGFQSWDPSC